MNDLLGSEFSSGCESGWTLYLEQSYLSQRRSLHEQHQYSGNNGKEHEDEEEEEEEDLSMVSDASSGPPHFHEEDEYGINNQNSAPNIDAKSAAKNGEKREKMKEYRCRKVQEQLCLLDDTASSPIFNFSNNNLALGDNQAPMENVLDFSQGHSSTHFQRKSALKKHFGIFQASVSGTQLKQNQWFEEKRVGMR